MSTDTELPDSSPDDGTCGTDPTVEQVEHDFTAAIDENHQVIPTGFCGTGEGGYVPPGEPVFGNTVLNARALEQGIELTWNYPGVNPAGVAWTEIYRSEVNDYATSIVLTQAGGSHYFDMNDVEEQKTYYYWIRMYTVNDNYGPVVGPASAIILPTNQIIIDMLVDSLNDSHLDNSLKQEIGRIGDISSGLTAEQEARLLGDSTLSDLWDELRVDLDYTDTFVGELATEVVTADSALAASISIMLAQQGENTAAISQEAVVRAEEDAALAIRIDTVEATAGEDSAAIQEQFTAVVNEHNQLEQEVYAEYTLKLQVNDYISGFGLFNDGQTSDFIIHADRFAIGKPLAAGTNPTEDTVYPFIVDYVDDSPVIALNAKALIPDASITNAMVENVISSSNWQGVGGNVGWAIYKDYFGLGGYAEFYNVKARGNIEATSIKAGTVDVVDTLMVQGNAIVVSNADNNPNTNDYAGASCSLTNLGGGRAYASGTCTVECDDSQIDLTLAIYLDGSSVASAVSTCRVKADVSSGSGVAKVTIPAALSAITLAGANVAYARLWPKVVPGASKNATVKNFTISLAGYKR